MTSLVNFLTRTLVPRPRDLLVTYEQNLEIKYLVCREVQTLDIDITRLLPHDRRGSILCRTIARLVVEHLLNVMTRLAATFR